MAHLEGHVAPQSLSPARVEMLASMLGALDDLRGILQL